MKIFGLFGIVAAFLVIFLIDKPKLEAEDNKKKYKAVYYSIVIAGVLIGVLELFNMIPHFDVIIADYYKQLSGTD